MDAGDKETILKHYADEGGRLSIDNLGDKMAQVSRDVNAVRIDVAELKQSQANEMRLLRKEVEAVAPFGVFYKDLLLVLLAVILTYWLTTRSQKKRAGRQKK